MVLRIFFKLLLLKSFTTIRFLNFISSTVTSYNRELRLRNWKRIQENLFKSIILGKIFTVLSTSFS